jgi:gas vesicle protein
LIRRRPALFRFLRRLVCLSVLLAVALATLAATRGGDPFRQFGKAVKEKSYRAGEAADLIRGTVVGIKRPAEKAVDAIRETGDKIRKVTGQTAEEAVAKAEETGEKVKDAAKDASEKATEAVGRTGERIKSLKGSDSGK